MKVPTLNRTVTPNPTLLNTPQLTKALPGAFGEDVAVAGKNLANTGLQMSDALMTHIAKRDEELRDERAYGEFVKISKESKELLLNNGTKTVKKEGKDYDIPFGVLNRVGNQADGALIDYDKDIDGYYKSHTSGMDKRTKDKFDKLFLLHNESIREKVLEHENKQRNEAVKQGFYELKDNTNDLMPLLDSEGKKASIKSVEDRITELQKAGRFTYEEAEKERKDFYNTIVKTDIYNDNSTEEKESKVLSELKKGEKGEYYFLDQDTKIKMMEETQRRIFQNNQTYKKVNEDKKDQRFNDIFDKQNAGTLSLKDIDNEFKISEDAGGIPKRDLLNFKKGVMGRTDSDLEVIVANNKDAEKYLTSIDTILDENDRAKAREYLAKSFGDGILSPKEASFLNKLKLETEDVEYNAKFEGSRNVFKNAVKAIREGMRHRKTATNADAALAIKKLINGINGGANSSDLVKEILYQDAIKRNPALLNIPEKGQLHIDADGSIKIIYPNLETEEVKGKNAD